MAGSSPEIEAIVRSFVLRLVDIVENQTIDRLRGEIIAAFQGSASTTQSALLGHRSPVAREDPPKARKLKLSPEAMAVRRLQGKYLGVLRALPPAARMQVKRIASEKGVAAAIEFASSST